MISQGSTPQFCVRMFARTSYSEAVWGWRALLTPPSKMSSHSYNRILPSGAAPRSVFQERREVAP